MSLFSKIEAIRQKPEHIRLRYVWFLVILSMTFILIIWIFSLKSQTPATPILKNDILSPDLTEELQAQKESWQETQQQFKNSLNESPDQPTEPTDLPSEQITQ